MQLQQLFDRDFARWFQQKRQLIHLLLLAATLTASNILAYAVAASLFLTKVGTTAIPLFYLLLGLLSVPVSAVFLKIIDRYSRPQIFRYLLLGAGIWVFLLFGFIGLDTAFVYYALYISFSILDLLFYVLLWTLASDYFNPLELERITASIAMSITVGGIISGSGVRLLSDLVKTNNLLLGLPLLYGFAIAQLFYLESSGQKPAIPVRETSDHLIKSIKNFPKIASKHPIVFLLFANTFVSVVIWTISELQFFNIYSATFPDSEEMAGFLGMLSAWFGILELSITYFLTRPMIQRWGVSRMNLIYPITTLLSFIFLFVVQLGRFNLLQLSAAIFANINYDPLNNSVSDPVQNLNYNAIPHRFIGRVRVLINGLFYPSCQALTGGVLLLQAEQKSPLKLALVGIAFSGVMAIVAYLTGKIYLRSVLLQLRLGSVTLDEVSEGLVQLPADYAKEVRQLMSHENSNEQLLGVELASRFADPSQFLDEIQTLLLRADEKVCQAVVKLLSSSNHPDFSRFLRTQLVSDSDAVRAVVLEALIVSGQPLSNVQLCFFLDDSHPEIRALACVAAWQTIQGRGKEEEKRKSKTKKNRVSQFVPQLTIHEVQAAYTKVWEQGMGITSQLAIIRVVNRMGNRQFLPLLKEMLYLAENDKNAWLMDAEIATVKQEGLHAIARLAEKGDESLAALAAAELTHPDPAVRVAALNLLGVVQTEKMFYLVEKALIDPHPMVRQAASSALAAYVNFHP